MEKSSKTSGQATWTEWQSLIQVTVRLLEGGLVTQLPSSVSGTGLPNPFESIYLNAGQVRHLLKRCLDDFFQQESALEALQSDGKFIRFTLSPKLQVSKDGFISLEIEPG